MSTELAEVQRRFADSVRRDSPTLDGIRGTDAQEVAERLGIYAFAYRSRLREALAHNFPMLATYLGDEAFRDLADHYNAEHPSTYASVRHVGSDFGRWLRKHRAGEPWLAEFATLEWALGLAFDAPDDAALTGDALGQVRAADWPQIRFQFAQGVQRLTLHSNAAELYGAAARADDMPAGGARESGEWLIWRESFTAHYRSMTPIEARAFDMAAAGKTFGELCETLLSLCSEHDVPVQAAACLKRWIEDRLILTLTNAAT